MKEKPILFSTEMVRAILDGRKTMTRRVVKPKYSNTHLEMRTDKYGTRLIEIQNEDETTHVKNPDGTTTHKILAAREIYAPYKPGDILWVRETWARVKLGRFDGHIYRADNDPDEVNWKWRPSIFMPLEAARIFLRVTDVRVERLQEISVQDAKDEGVKVHANGCIDGLAYGCYNGDECVYNRCKRPKEYFRELWDSLNAKRGYGWDTNPFVWVISFERVPT